jgi:GT2 family glycosyltransferase
LRAQTIFDRTEVILVDNTSTDGSAEMCEKEMAGWLNGTLLPTGGNYGFGGGSNRGAKIARGKYLFFLNPDVWLEPNCLEELVRRAEDGEIKIAGPLVLDYDSDNIQVMGASGFDLFGGMIPVQPGGKCDRLFVIGTFFFVERELFQKLDGFDEVLFLYNEETDLSWRAWIADEPISLIPSAHIHHQGASSGERAVENRTNETKRYFANRNQLLVIVKNARSFLLLLALSQVTLIGIEAMVGTCLARRPSFIYWALIKPLADCWRLRGHILAQRKKNSLLRQHGDWWITKHFFRFGFGRWTDVKRLFKFGIRIEKSWPTTAPQNK